MKWISVKDRLPEEFYSVLVYLKKDEYVREGYRAHDSIWMVAFENDKFTDDITHWMPLPKPPKKEVKK